MGPERLTHDELLNRLKALVRQEREDTAAVVAYPAEVDPRDLERPANIRLLCRAHNQLLGGAPVLSTRSRTPAS